MAEFLDTVRGPRAAPNPQVKGESQGRTCTSPDLNSLHILQVVDLLMVKSLNRFSTKLAPEAFSAPLPGLCRGRGMR